MSTVHLIINNPPSLSLDMFGICFRGRRWAVSTEARRRFSDDESYLKEKPSYAKDSEGEGGPSWARTSDPLIMSQVLLTS